MKDTLRVYADHAAVSEALAESITEQTATTSAEGFFYLALAGGNTPRTLYELLATNFRDRISWDRVHLFWGDERYVQPTDPQSNYRLVRECLLDRIKIPSSNVHPMPTDFEDPDDAAKHYEGVLREHFSTSWPTFSTVLLGLGADGHTASLFPGSPALEERKRWVSSTLGPNEPRLRLTLTLPALAHAKQVYFIVTGADKADAIRRTLTDGNTPAARLVAEKPNAVFWTDAEASRYVRHDSISS